MGLSEVCIRRPVMTTLITAAIIVFGVFAYRLLPVAALPAVDFPTIEITATLPGASPETMAASVASPIERQLSTIAGITSMTSSSSLGTTRDHHPVRPQPQHRRRRARRADRARRRAAPAADRDDDAAVLPQGQSGRLSDPVHQPEFRRRCRCRRSTNTPSSCWRSRFRSCRASRRCWSTARRNSPCASRSIRSRPRAQHLARRHPQRRRQGQFQHAGRHARRPAPEHHADGVRGHDPKAEDYRKRRGRLAQRRRRSSSTRSPASSTASRTTRSRAGSTSARSIVLAIQRQPDANTVEVVDSVKRAAADVPRAGAGVDQHGRC